MKMVNSKKEIRNITNDRIREVVERLAEAGEMEGIGYVCILTKNDDPEDIRLTSSSPGLSLTDPPYPAKYMLSCSGKILRVRMVCNERCTANFIVTGDNIAKVAII